MKKLIILLLLAATTLAFGAEKIEATYAGATLEKTTRAELMNYYLKNSDFKTGLLTLGENSQAYNGDFLVDSLHFHTFVAEFYNDTVYRITFFESSLNSDNEQLYANFLRREKVKYKNFTALDTSSFMNTIPEDEKYLVWRTDGISEVTILNRGYGVSFEIHNKRLSTLAFHKSMENLGLLNTPDTDPKNKVTGVAGLQFGETRSDIVSKVKNKWERLAVDDKSLTYGNVHIGGQLFDVVNLYFIYDQEKQTQILYSVLMQKIFHTWEYDEALQQYETICSMYRNKYSNERTIDSGKDNKQSAYGMVSLDYADGKLPPIVVSLTKSLSQGGEFRYYVLVSYYGIKTDNLYDDEI